MLIAVFLYSCLMSRCRLCQEAAEEVFRTKVLRKYDVAYYRCAGCGSVQTEAPYWLEEAYSSSNLAAADTGAVARNLNCQAAVFAVTRILRVPRRASILDYGGGNGLLCRLLRDCGFDAYVSDLSAVNDFAQGFDDKKAAYDVICAFEVAEHFANPRSDMTKILGRSAPLCIIGTEVYHGQSADWWYLSPASGQHVFFYSREGLAKLGAMFGYAYVGVGSVHLFLNRSIGTIERSLLRFMLPEARLRWVRAYLSYSLTYAYAAKDAGIS
jgi:hypothetical protein